MTKRVQKMSDTKNPSSSPPVEPRGSTAPPSAGSNALMQRLSSEFITAQNSMDRTVTNLRTKMRAMGARIEHVLNQLEREGPTAGVEQLAGIGEEGLAVERLARQLREQKEDIEKSIDAARACARRSGV